MTNVNITEVRLLNVPLERDYKHTLYFVDETKYNNFVNKLNQFLKKQQ